MKREIIAFALVAVLALIGSSLVIGCVGTPSHKTTPTPVPKKSAEIVVKDFRGKTISLKAPAQRIVVIGSYWAEALVALGAGSRIVGIGNWVKYDDYLPEYVKEKPTVGSVFSGLEVEKIASLRPDVVVTDLGYGKASQEISQLERMHIPVVAMFIQNFTDELRAISILGKITGEEQRAQELISWEKKIYSKIKEMASKIPSSDRVTAVILSGYSLINKGEIVLDANTSWGHTITDAGAINLALKYFPKEKWPKIDFGTLAKWNPDVIVLTSTPADVQKVLDYVKNSTKWKALKAYKEGHIYAVPCWSWYGGVLDWGPRDIIGREYIAKALYPDLYSSLHWRRDMEYLLDHFYGIFVPAQAFIFYALNYMTVLDPCGNLVKVPRHISRIADFVTYQTLIALNLTKEIVAVSKYAKMNPLILKAWPGVVNVSSPGGGIFKLNVEELAEARPQLVILWPYNPDLVKNIERLGIPVIQVFLYSYKDIERMIWLYGMMFNREERALELLHDMSQILSIVKKREQSVTSKVKVLYLWSTPTTVEGGKGTVNSYIELAGGINVAAKTYPNRDYVKVGFEQIASWNPQVIVIWYFARYGPQQIYNNSQWAEIAAVKDHRVYKEPYYDHWSPDAALFVLWLAEKLYPQDFKGVNFYQVANQYYEKWYGVKYTEAFGGNKRWKG